MTARRTVLWEFSIVLFPLVMLTRPSECYNECLWKSCELFEMKASFLPNDIWTKKWIAPYVLVQQKVWVNGLSPCGVPIQLGTCWLCYRSSILSGYLSAVRVYWCIKMVNWIKIRTYQIVLKICQTHLIIFRPTILGRWCFISLFFCVKKWFVWTPEETLGEGFRDNNVDNRRAELAQKKYWRLNFVNPESSSVELILGYITSAKVKPAILWIKIEQTTSPNYELKVLRRIWAIKITLKTANCLYMNGICWFYNVYKVFENGLLLSPSVGNTIEQ